MRCRRFGAKLARTAVLREMVAGELTATEATTREFARTIMHDRYNTLASLLFEIEKELRTLQLWAVESPSAEALASEQPFAVDTLSFSQWLQFIFLPKMYQIVESARVLPPMEIVFSESAGELPSSCSIAPMAEMSFAAEKIDARSIIRQLKALDRFICDQ